MKDYKYSLGSSRGKKLWITVYKDINNKYDSKGNLIEMNDISINVELNIIDKVYKIVWINTRVQGKDNFTSTLGVEEDKQIIADALQFAINNKYTDRIVIKYAK